MKKQTNGSNLAPTLSKWRKAAQLTQEQAAAQIGTPLGTYRDCEQGRSSPRGLALRTLETIIGKGASSDPFASSPQLPTRS